MHLGLVGGGMIIIALSECPACSFCKSLSEIGFAGSADAHHDRNHALILFPEDTA
jgi:hypothetical protein